MIIDKGENLSLIVLLGDSITEAFPVGQLLADFHVANMGVSGDRTDLVLARLVDVIALTPSAVFILVGTNDIASFFSNDRLLVNYEKILLRLQRGIPGVKLFVQSILPTRSLPNRPNERIQILNVNLHKLALRYGAEFLDLYPLFVDKEGNLAEEYSDDGLHLTPAAYHTWADYLRIIFRAML